MMRYLSIILLFFALEVFAENKSTKPVIYAIHSTPIFPVNMILMTGGISPELLTEKNLENPPVTHYERTTIHFSVYGIDPDRKINRNDPKKNAETAKLYNKYKVILPISALREHAVMGTPRDIVILGPFQIPMGAYIFVPENELQKRKTAHPKRNILGYSSEEKNKSFIEKIIKRVMHPFTSTEKLSINSRSLYLPKDIIAQLDELNIHRIKEFYPIIIHDPKNLIINYPEEEIIEELDSGGQILLKGRDYDHLTVWIAILSGLKIGNKLYYKIDHSKSIPKVNLENLMISLNHAKESGLYGLVDFCLVSNKDKKTSFREQINLPRSDFLIRNHLRSVFDKLGHAMASKDPHKITIALNNFAIWISRTQRKNLKELALLHIKRILADKLFIEHCFYKVKEYLGNKRLKDYPEEEVRAIEESISNINKQYLRSKPGEDSIQKIIHGYLD